MTSNEKFNMAVDLEEHKTNDNLNRSRRSKNASSGSKKTL